MGSLEKGCFKLYVFVQLFMSLRWNEEKLKFIQVDYIKIDNSVVIMTYDDARTASNTTKLRKKYRKIIWK